MWVCEWVGGWVNVCVGDESVGGWGCGLGGWVMCECWWRGDLGCVVWLCMRLGRCMGDVRVCVDG